MPPAPAGWTISSPTPAITPGASSSFTGGTARHIPPRGRGPLPPAGNQGGFSGLRLPPGALQKGGPHRVGLCPVRQKAGGGGGRAGIVQSDGAAGGKHCGFGIPAGPCGRGPGAPGGAGFIFAAREEFGIVAVEAQAAGTPVIAFGAGGSLETVQGVFPGDWPRWTPPGYFFGNRRCPLSSRPWSGLTNAAGQSPRGPAGITPAVLTAPVLKKSSGSLWMTSGASSRP